MTRVRQLLSGAVLVSVLTPSMSAAPSTPGPVGTEVGTVTTIAGPGFCEEAGRLDRDSTAVRALAVDDEGYIYFDTGPPDAGVIGKVGIDGQARLVRTGIPAPAEPTDPVPVGARAVSPAGRLAPDREGGVLVAAGDRVVQVRSDESPHVIAGDPTVAPGGDGENGDGGPALGARFTAIESITSDEAGNVYVVERQQGTSLLQIRFVNRGPEPVTFYRGTPHELTVAPAGIATIAGGAGAGDHAGPVAATLAALAGRLPGLAVRGGTLLYLASYAPSSSSSDPVGTVQVVNLQGEPVVVHGVALGPGMVGTVAGGGRTSADADGRPARDAALSYLPGIAVDDKGNLFIADERAQRIRRVDADGTLTTFAGTEGPRLASGGFNGNGRPATEAALNHPFDVEVGPGGLVYIADQFNDQVRYVEADGTIRAAPGSGVGLGWTCDDGTTASSLSPPGMPASVAAGGQGDVYLVAATQGQVKRLELTGERVTNVIPSSTADAFCAIRSDCPRVLAGPGELLYVFDGRPARLRAVNLGTAPLRAHGVTIPGQQERELAQAGSPGPIALAPNGTLFLADLAAGAVRRLDAEGAMTTVVDGRVATAGSCCQQPSGLAVDPAGNLYVSDGFPGGRIWFINLGTTAATVHGHRVPPGSSQPVAGSGATERGFGGDGGPALEAQFRSPGALAADGRGNLYILDVGESTVRQVDTAGVISTAVGTGSFGFNGDGLDGPLTMLSSPTAMAFDHCGNLVIADHGNDRLRRLNLGGPCEMAALPAPPGGAGRYPVVLVASVAVVLLGLAGVAVVVRRSRSTRAGWRRRR